MADLSTHSILLLVAWCVNLCVLSPLELWWAVKFYSNRKKLIIYKRQPAMLLAQCVCYTIYTVLNNSIFTVNTVWKPHFLDVMYPFWMDYSIYISFVYCLALATYRVISNARWWLMLFMIKTSSILKDDWRNIIDPHYAKHDWYLKHSQSYGSWRSISRPLLVFGVTAAIAWTADFYIVQSTLIDNDYLYALDWFFYIWYLFFNELLSLIVLSFILVRIPILDDTIGLKKELKTIAYFGITNLILFTAYYALDAVQIQQENDNELVLSIMVNLLGLMRLCVFGVNYISTYWVMDTFHIKSGKRRSNGVMDSSSINLSTGEIRKMIHETTLRLLEDSNALNDSDEQREKLEMKCILSKNVVFSAFMRHLLKEHCHECLLSIIEMIQYKQRIFNEDLSENQRILVSQSKNYELTKHFLEIPDGCTQSSIVYGSIDARYKSIAKAIYDKYVKEDTAYQVNIEYGTRKDLAAKMEDDSWGVNDEYDDLLDY